MFFLALQALTDKENMLQPSYSSTLVGLLGLQISLTHVPFYYLLLESIFLSICFPQLNI